MTTLKGPTPPINPRNNNSSGTNGFTVLLFLVTWLALFGLFYAVKSGALQTGADLVTHDEVSALETRIAQLEAKVVKLEKKVAPEDSSEAKPVEPAPTQVPVVPGAGVQPVEPLVPSQPEGDKQPDIQQDKKDGGASVDPKSGVDSGAGHTENFEKKNYSMLRVKGSPCNMLTAG